MLSSIIRTWRETVTAFGVLMVERAHDRRIPWTRCRALSRAVLLLTDTFGRDEADTILEGLGRLARFMEFDADGLNAAILSAARAVRSGIATTPHDVMCFVITWSISLAGDEFKRPKGAHVHAG